jgi:hypothetical protein
MFIYFVQDSITVLLIGTSPGKSHIFRKRVRKVIIGEEK